MSANAFYRQTFGGLEKYVGRHYGASKIRVREYCTEAKEGEHGWKIQIHWNGTWNVASSSKEAVQATISWLVESELGFLRDDIERNAIGPLQIHDSLTEEELQRRRDERRQQHQEQGDEHSENRRDQEQRGPNRRHHQNQGTTRRQSIRFSHDHNGKPASRQRHN